MLPPWQWRLEHTIAKHAIREQEPSAQARTANLRRSLVLHRIKMLPHGQLIGVSKRLWSTPTKQKADKHQRRANRAMLQSSRSWTTCLRRRIPHGGLTGVFWSRTRIEKAPNDFDLGVRGSGKAPHSFVEQKTEDLTTLSNTQSQPFTMFQQIKLACQNIFLQRKQHLNVLQGMAGSVPLLAMNHTSWCLLFELNP